MFDLAQFRSDAPADAALIQTMRLRFATLRRLLASRAEALHDQQLIRELGRRRGWFHRLRPRRRPTLKRCYADVAFDRDGLARRLRELNHNLARLDPSWSLWPDAELLGPLTPKETRHERS